MLTRNFSVFYTFWTVGNSVIAFTFDLTTPHCRLHLLNLENSLFLSLRNTHCLLHLLHCHLSSLSLPFLSFFSVLGWSSQIHLLSIILEFHSSCSPFFLSFVPVENSCSQTNIVRNFLELSQDWRWVLIPIMSGQTVWRRHFTLRREFPMRRVASRHGVLTARMTHLDLQKRFPIHHACPKYLAAHCCGSAFL